MGPGLGLTFTSLLVDLDRHLARRKQKNYLNEINFFLSSCISKLYLLSVDSESHKTNKNSRKTIIGEFFVVRNTLPEACQEMNTKC